MSGEFAEVNLNDERLKGVTKEAVTCDCFARSFDLKVKAVCKGIDHHIRADVSSVQVMGLGGEIFRLRVPVLEHTIIPSACKYVPSRQQLTVLRSNYQRLAPCVGSRLQRTVLRCC